MDKVRILCFGDSYTRGYIPWTDHERFSETIRFPKKLQELLGLKSEIIEEWLNSRTLTSEDKRPGKEGRNGSSYLIPCIDTHDPLDLIVLMLWTNELKHSFENEPEYIGMLLEKLFVKVILGRKSQFKEKYPQVLIISLPIINDKTEYAWERYIGAASKSQQLTNIYAKIAEKNNCYFVDASSLMVGIDGVHFTKESHIKLAEMICKKIESITF